MAIRVALHHETVYAFDAPVPLSPHEVRLRPAPHARTPIASYSLRVTPERHFVNWQQDPYGNWVARFVFPEPTRELSFTVDLVASMTVINPFDFFVEQYAEHYPFTYTEQLAYELAPYLTPEPASPRFAAWLDAARREVCTRGITTTDFLVGLNRRAASDIRYLVRMEPGVQTPEETLDRGSGSCRDSGWLLVQAFRHLGLAARFVSGYLDPARRRREGARRSERSRTRLHRPACLGGGLRAGRRLDRTRSDVGPPRRRGTHPARVHRRAGERGAGHGLGHERRAGTTRTSRCRSRACTRIRASPSRTTTPSGGRSTRSGEQVDGELLAHDVRLTQGGEPTFVSIDDMEGAEWNTAALVAEASASSPASCYAAADAPVRTRALLHVGQGKWYPGEPLPRWALGVLLAHRRRSDLARPDR